METKQEIKSLPRNRKCGNCRYFEPAPLWRKGWCRNPRLYDRRANHLVDATTIDCEQVFRARIYWEPIPSTDNREAELGYSPFTGVAAADSGEQDFSRNRISTDGVLRSQVPVSGSGRDGQPAGSNLPVINRAAQTRERAGAAPGLIPRENRLRIWLIENIPYYDRIDGPLMRLNLLKILPWLIVAALLLFLLLNVLGGGNRSGSNATTTPGTTSGIVSPLQTTAPVSAPNLNGKPQATATPTLSTLVPTQTPIPAPTATPVRTETFAQVVKVGRDGLRMRKEPGTASTIQILEQIPEGERVKIRDEQFRTVDGIIWWPISYKGKDGWASADYLQKINP
jgi:Bacterial SH3 domain